MPKPIKKIDIELARLTKVIDVFDDLWQKMATIKIQHGADGEARCIQYIKSRKGWVLDIFK